MFPLVLLSITLVPMAAEALIAARHDRALRAEGAVEPAGDVYSIMQFAYPACFLAMAGEGWARSTRPDALSAAGAALFVAAKLLKYWAIATLGPRWSFRVLVPRHSTRITGGPYRFVNHPNYLAVAMELAGMGLMAHAPVTGTAAVAGFGALILVRIRVEERALGMRS
jgi:methyltransferase